MDLKFIYPHWGSEDLGAMAFIRETASRGFDGIEINLPDDPDFRNELNQEIEKLRNNRPDFVYIAQQVLGPAKESAEAYLDRVLERLKVLIETRPDFHQFTYRKRLLHF